MTPDFASSALSSRILPRTSSKVFGREIACIHTEALRIVEQRNEDPNLLNREVELTASANGREALDALAAVDALVPSLACGLSEQTDLVVVADGRRRCACAVRRVALRPVFLEPG
jgi:hypothetical protein